MGNNAYTTGTVAQFQSTFLTSFGNIAATTSLQTVFGYKDSLGSNGVTNIGPYFDQFSIPASTIGVASGQRTYYSYDWGSLHFVVLDSVSQNRSVGAPMWQWLQADLAAANATGTMKWLIAMFSNSPYAAGASLVDTTSNNIDMRVNFLPVLVRGPRDSWY